MPNRIIKESICTSDNLDTLSWQEEVFFYRLLVNCDDYGRFDARPAILRSRCFPLKISKVTEKQILGWLKTLSHQNLIKIYEIEGQRYLYVPTWEKHQQIRAKRSKYPAPDSNGNHLIADDSICTRNPIQSESESNPNTSTPAPEKVKTTYGEFKNVSLSKAEYDELVKRFGAQEATYWIEELSHAKASKGYKTKSDYATILAWERRGKRDNHNGGQNGKLPEKRVEANRAIPGNRPGGAFDGFNLDED